MGHRIVMDDMLPDHGSSSGDAAPVSSITSRRMLMLGAVGASTVVAIRPALAQATGSVLACQIPVPDPGNAGKYIKSDGTLVAPFTLGAIGAYPPPSRPFTGEEVRQALYNGANLPGTGSGGTRAYLAYIKNLRPGQTGFTCFNSVQNPRG